MRNKKINNRILRCYGYRSKKGSYVGVCLELNLAAEAKSPHALRQKMNEVIATYIEAVIDTEDKESIDRLLNRHAPSHDFLIYYLIRLALFIRRFPDKFTFQSVVPFNLAHNT